MTPIRPTQSTVPPLVRLLVTHAAGGALFGLAFVGCLIAFNVSNIRTLMGQAESTSVVLYMLILGFMATFGSLAMGLGVWAASQEDVEQARGKPRPKLRLPSDQIDAD